MKKFVHLRRLEDPEIVADQQTNEEQFISGTFIRRALANSTVFGKKATDPIHNYVIGVNQRGTLQMTDKEFDDLLSCMIKLHEHRHALKKES